MAQVAKTVRTVGGTRFVSCEPCDGHGFTTEYVKGTVHRQVHPLHFVTPWPYVSRRNNRMFEPVRSWEGAFTLKGVPDTLRNDVRTHLGSQFPVKPNRVRARLSILPAVEVTYWDGRAERVAYIVGRERYVVAIDERRLSVIGLRLKDLARKVCSEIQKSPRYRLAVATVAVLLGAWCPVG